MEHLGKIEWELCVCKCLCVRVHRYEALPTVHWRAKYLLTWHRCRADKRKDMRVLCLLSLRPVTRKKKIHAYVHPALILSLPLIVVCMYHWGIVMERSRQRETEKASEEERWTEWKRVTKLDSRAAKKYILMALSRNNLLPEHLPTKVVDVLYLELVAADCCRYWLHLNLPLSREVGHREV